MRTRGCRPPLRRSKTGGVDGAHLPGTISFVVGSRKGVGSHLQNMGMPVTVSFGSQISTQRHSLCTQHPTDAGGIRTGRVREHSPATSSDSEWGMRVCCSGKEAHLSRLGCTRTRCPLGTLLFAGARWSPRESDSSERICRGR